MQVLESKENYLKRILVLKEKLSKVRSIDIVRDMGFSKPSVSIAIKNLKSENYVTVDQKGYIFLTEKGEKIAKETLLKLETVINALVRIGVSLKQARIDACKIEHVLSDESFNAIKKIIDSAEKV